MRRFDRGSHRRHLVVTCAMATLAFVTACGGSPATPAPPASGFASVVPPVTASPSVQAGASASALIPSDSTTPAATAAATTPPTTATTPAATAAPTMASTPAPTPVSPATPMPAVKVALAKVVAGLPRPVAVANAGDGRLFVVDQAGKILIVNGGAVAGTFLDITARVATTGTERGLLGLAFHPQYATNGRFFVRYTVPSGDVRISEFHVTSDPNKADPGTERVLLTIPHRSYPNHNGGTIAFGPDGYLYIGTGDGGGAGDPKGNAQNLSVLLGKMLRIDVDHASAGTNYAIPSDNPFVGQAGTLGEIWAYGLRNPYSFTFDRATGDLWIADVGQDLWEEVDRATAAQGLGRGANFGWNVMEANHCYKPASGCDPAGKVLPLAEYNHGTSDSIGCSIIGGAVYRGTAHQELVGRYFFGDYCSGKIWDVEAAGPATQTPALLVATGLKTTGWGQGADGELYVVADNGGMYQLV